MITVLPTGPLPGVKLLMVGPTTVKFVAVETAPKELVTVMTPVVAPFGTVVSITVGDKIWKLETTPLKATEVVPRKLVPAMKIGFENDPEAADTPAMVGAAPGVIVKAVVLALPLGVTTVIGPVVAPAGTSTESCVSVDEISAGLTTAPLNVTAEILDKPLPVMMTRLPTTPLPGVKPVITGAAGVKLVLLRTVPPGVVIEMGPAVTPKGTCAEICVEERTRNEVEASLNETSLAFVKFVPVIITVEPLAPVVGVKLVSVGAATGRTLKFVAEVAKPPLVTTVMGPVVALNGTVARICEAESTEKLPDTPLKSTWETFENFVPTIVTVEPANPLPGPKLLIVGAKTGAVLTVKFPVLVAMPEVLTTAMGPVVAPLGTLTVIWVGELTVKLPVRALLNNTSVTPIKFVPVIVTEVPEAPLLGVKPVIVGIAADAVGVKLVALATKPPGVVTVIGPAVAPAGTVASI